MAHNMNDFTKDDIILSSHLLCTCFVFYFPSDNFLLEHLSVFSSFVTINRMTDECKNEWENEKKKCSNYRWNVQRFDVLMEKSTRPCNFIYFSRSKWFCWTSMCLYVFFTSSRSLSHCVCVCFSLLFSISFDNLHCWLSSMLTWWKVSSICYTVLFGFNSSSLHLSPFFWFRFVFFFRFMFVCVCFFLQFFSPFLTFFRFQYVQTWFSISIGPNAMASLICQCDTEQKPEMAESIPKDREKNRNIRQNRRLHSKCLSFRLLFSLLIHNWNTWRWLRRRQRQKQQRRHNIQRLLFDGNVNKPTIIIIIEKSLLFITTSQVFVALCWVLFLTKGVSIWIQNAFNFMNHDKCEFLPKIYRHTSTRELANKK